MICDRCGQEKDGIMRYLEGWLCDNCSALLHAVPDNNYLDDFVYADEDPWDWRGHEEANL